MHSALLLLNRLAMAQLGFNKLTEPVRRQIVAHLRQIRGATTNATELLISARKWLYEHRYLIPAKRQSLDICRAVLINQQTNSVAEVARLL